MFNPLHMMIKGIPTPFGYEVEYMHSMYQLFLLKASQAL